MKTLYELLTKHGIEIRNHRNGNRKTTCPKCSHLRKNRKDPCLSLLIDASGIAFHCHHCGHKGGDYFDDLAPPHDLARSQKDQSRNRGQVFRAYR